MSLTFYYAPMSTASITELVLAELGVPCEKVKLDISKGETRKPEFTKLNPNGKVPLIVHDGTAIFESSAITMYLGETFGVDKGLYPAPGPKRGEAMKWIAWTNVSFGDAVGRFTRNTMRWYPDDQKNDKAAEAAKKDIGEHLRILDGALEGKEFLLGSFSLVDSHLSSFISWVQSMPIDFSAYPNVVAWAKRCGERPAAKAMTAAGHA